MMSVAFNHVPLALSTHIQNQHYLDILFQELKPPDTFGPLLNVKSCTVAFILGLTFQGAKEFAIVFYFVGKPYIQCESKRRLIYIKI